MILFVVKELTVISQSARQLNSATAKEWQDKFFKVLRQYQAFDSQSFSGLSKVPEDLLLSTVLHLHLYQTVHIPCSRTVEASQVCFSAVFVAKKPVVKCVDGGCVTVFGCEYHQVTHCPSCAMAIIASCRRGNRKPDRGGDLRQQHSVTGTLNQMLPFWFRHINIMQTFPIKMM